MRKEISDTLAPSSPKASSNERLGLRSISASELSSHASSSDCWVALRGRV
jgi:cytochrome b involved in lipid metabolism